MLSALKHRAQFLLRHMGFQPALARRTPRLPFWCADMARRHVAIEQRVRAQVGSRMQCLSPLCQTIAFLEQEQVPGALVQCGPAQGGGNLMAAALALLFYENTRRSLFVFDPGAAIPAPAGTADDVDFDRAALDFETLRGAMMQTRYPWEKLIYVAGRFEQTLPEAAPRAIALLHLTTDRFDATYQVLEQLYPFLVDGAVLLLEDDGHKLGALRALHAYLSQHDREAQLHALDGTGWLVVKTSHACVLAA